MKKIVQLQEKKKVIERFYLDKAFLQVFYY